MPAEGRLGNYDARAERLHALPPSVVAAAVVAFLGSVAPVQDSLKGRAQLWQKLAVIPELHASGSTGYACSA